MQKWYNTIEFALQDSVWYCVLQSHIATQWNKDMQCSAIWYYEWQFQCYILHIAIYADSSAAGKRYDIGHMQQITACRYSVPDTVWTISPDPECNCLSQTLLHVYMEQKTILRSSNWSVSLDLKIFLTDHLCVSCTCRLQTAIFSVQWSPPKKSIICQRRGFLRQKWAPCTWGGL